jgi:GT2 family glycosyltransferase
MSEKKEKIGVGIITCNRKDYLVNLLESIAYRNDLELVIINDGGPLEVPGWNYYVVNNETNLGVGKSKNRAMQHLLDKGCDYIFIIEDDCIILDETVFEQYIKASKQSGIQHFNFGPGTPFNRVQSITDYDLHNRDQLLETSKPNPLITIDYNHSKIDLYPHCAGVFSFFTRRILTQIGLHDEDFYNAWEHIDHTYRIIQAGAHPQFWWFADIHNSIMCVDTQRESIKRSSTSCNKEEWFENIRAGREIYKKKHGFYPNMTPSSTKQDVINCLKQIKQQWTT